MLNGRNYFLDDKIVCVLSVWFWPWIFIHSPPGKIPLFSGFSASVMPETGLSTLPRVLALYPRSQMDSAGSSRSPEWSLNKRQHLRSPTVAWLSLCHRRYVSACLPLPPGWTRPAFKLHAGVSAHQKASSPSQGLLFFWCSSNLSPALKFTAAIVPSLNYLPFSTAGFGTCSLWCSLPGPWYLAQEKCHTHFLMHRVLRASLMSDVFCT